MINKRLIMLASAAVGIILIAGLALWLILRSPAQPTETTTETATTTEETTTSTPIAPATEGEFTVFKLSDAAAISPTISDNKVLYYSKTNGNVLSTDFEGKSRSTVTDISIPNLITTLWSFDKSKAINIYKENELIKKVLFDFSDQKAIQLDSRIKFINFSPTKDRIVYQFVDPSLNTNKIAVSDPNGLNWKSLQSIRMSDVRLFWPKEDTIAILTSPSGLAKGSLLTTNSDTGGTLNKTISELFGLTVKFSPDGNTILYSQTDQYGHNPALYTIKNGGSPDKISINTISDKCSFSLTNNIYCAVPSKINGSSILPDDFYKNTVNFSDIFFKIDTSNNRSSAIFNPTDFKYDFNASDLMVSSDENYIIFINKKDGLLYSIKIK